MVSMKSSRKRRCIIHIGAPKTGSTALQRFLSDNLAPLVQDGFLYPSSFMRGGGHHDLAFFCHGGYPEWATPDSESLESSFDRLKLEISNSPLDVILSSENFYWLCSPDTVARRLNEIGLSPQHTTVVVYLRRQEEVIPSWYSQAVKALGYSGTPEQHMAEHCELWDYPARLAPWAANFGSKNILVRPYAENANICRDFISALGLQAMNYRFDSERINPHLNRDILEFQRLLNQLPLPTIQKRRYIRELERFSEISANTMLFDTHSLLDQDALERIREKYAAGNREIAERYLQRSELFPRHTEEAPPPSSFEPYAGLTVEKTVAIFGWLLLSINRDEAH